MNFKNIESFSGNIPPERNRKIISIFVWDDGEPELCKDMSVRYDPVREQWLLHDQDYRKDDPENPAIPVHVTEYIYRDSIPAKKRVSSFVEKEDDYDDD